MLFSAVAQNLKPRHCMIGSETYSDGKLLNQQKSEGTPGVADALKKW